MLHTMPPLRRVGAMAALCLGFVILADWLFYDQPKGWTIGGFIAAIAFMLVASWPGVVREAPARILLAAIAGLVVALVIEPTPHAFLLAAIALLTLAALCRQGWTNALGAWCERWLEISGRMVAQPALDMYTVLRAASRSGYRRVRAIALINKWWLGLILGLVFGGLLALANPVLNKWLDNVGESLNSLLADFDRFAEPVRLILWVFIAAIIWGLLRTRSKRRVRLQGPSSAAWASVDRCASVATVVHSLAIFNAVFAVQTVLDIVYLWGGAALPDGMTYAEYAHRGAYPLVATALLAGLFVLITFRAGGPSEQSRPARVLVYLWIGQNIFLLVSAAWRLDLYVEAYSLTRWRLAAGIWMLAIIIGFAWVVVRLAQARRNAWLLQVNALTALAIVYICAFVDVDGQIARFNVRHCREIAGSGPPIDLNYLESLGPESLPAIQTLASAPLVPALKERVLGARHRLRANLDHDLYDWRGWTVRRAQLDQLPKWHLVASVR